MTGRLIQGRVVVVLLAGCALGVALPAAAQAGVVTASEQDVPDPTAAHVFHHRVTYIAGPGQTNRLTLEDSGDAAVVTDPAGVTPGSGCSRPNPAVTTRAVCPFSTGGGITFFTTTRIELGDGNDRVAPLPAVGASIDGGPGNDVLNGSFGEDVIRGGPGNDQMFGRQGDDRFKESGGSADGADLISGGPNRTDTGPVFVDGMGRHGGHTGLDVVDFSGRRHAVRADLSGDGGDGEPGEHDHILSDVEALVGGSKGDRLTGNGRRNQVSGGPGNDRIKGGNGNDSLSGKSGRDRISGGGGSDVVSGGSGGDRLEGGRGLDDQSGGSGNDLLRARDGRGEQVACGRGHDHVLVDVRDMVFRSCERIDRKGSPPSALALPSRRADPLGFPAPRGEFEVEYDHRGVDGRILNLNVGCPADAGGTCHMHVFLKRHGHVVGDKRVTVGPGRSKDEVRLRTSRSFAELVGDRGFVQAQIVTKSRTRTFRTRRSQPFLVVDPAVDRRG